jgi:hypothetical protein
MTYLDQYEEEMGRVAIETTNKRAQKIIDVFIVMMSLGSVFMTVWTLCAVAFGK